MYMPRVSVIIPNYNHSKYLDQRIRSVLSQTYQDFEIILLDDCSTDSSREILNNYSKSSKVTHIVFNKENSGSTFKQWKKGIDLAAGELIWIAESDDWCEPTLLETLIEGIDKDEDCVISYCQSYCVNDDEKIIFQSSHSRLSEIIDGKLFIQEYLSVPVSIYNTSMVIWKKDKFQFISDEFMSYKFCGDWLFWIELSKFGKVHVSGRILNYFRKHGGDVSGKAYQSGLNFIEELKVIDSIFKANLITEQKYYNAYKKKFIEYWMVKDTIDKTYKKNIKKLFSAPLSSKINLVKFIPLAIWKKTKQQRKNKRNKHE